MSFKSLPIVAIVGQPNAGKSALLNKIGKQRLAITSDVPGTTRDRQYMDTAWNGRGFTLVDTAGLNLNPISGLELELNKQIDIALSQADAIIWVVDGKEAPQSIPQAIRQKFRKIKKPTLLCVNKLDSPKTREEKLAEFMPLGIKPLFGVSALTGAGIGDMLDALTDVIKSRWESSAEGAEDSHLGESIAVSIVGKPNVGKSSIFNKILNEERVVVSPVPGTTRAAIDSAIRINGINYTFIDTAGLKKKEHRQQEPDIFSGFQTFKSIRKSDICFFCLDASEEITKQDQRVAQEIFAMEKGCIILANKCDLIAKNPSPNKLGKNVKAIEKNRDDQYSSVRDYISHHFPFLWMCPLFFVSALTNEGIEEAVTAVKPIFDRRLKTIAEETLKEFLKKTLKKNPPKLLRDQKKPKVFSLHQVGTNPPAFQLKVNHPAAISSQFRKYLENSIIRDLEFWGTPIILKLKGKDKT